MLVHGKRAPTYCHEPKSVTPCHLFVRLAWLACGPTELAGQLDRSEPVMTRAAASASFEMLRAEGNNKARRSSETSAPEQEALFGAMSACWTEGPQRTI